MGFSIDNSIRSTAVLRVPILADFPDLLCRYHKRQEMEFNITITRYQVEIAHTHGLWKN